jgi:TfoX/Sxy family transcriptional regulator of competence genes
MKPALKSSSTMDHLAERIRALVGFDPRVTEKTMFGGLTFLLNNHILVGCKKDGRILLSVGKEHNDEALRRPGTTQMVHRDRPMTGFIWVEPDAIEDDEALEEWVKLATRWVERMPIEEPKAKPAPRKAPAKKAPAKKAAAKAPKTPATR